MAGQDILKSKMRLVLWGLLGDLDFFFKDLGMRNWNACGEGGMCNFCPANTLPLEDPSSVPWTDARKSALWKALKYILNLEVWAHVPPSSHPLWQLDGMSRFFFMLDCLHCLESKGVASHCVGNCLVTILQEQVGRRNAGKEFLERAWKDLWTDMCKVAEELKAEGKIKYVVKPLELAWFWHGPSE